MTRPVSRPQTPHYGITTSRPHPLASSIYIRDDRPHPLAHASYIRDDRSTLAYILNPGHHSPLVANRSPRTLGRVSRTPTRRQTTRLAHHVQRAVLAPASAPAPASSTRSCTLGVCVASHPSPPPAAAAASPRFVLVSPGPRSMWGVAAAAQGEVDVPNSPRYEPVSPGPGPWSVPPEQEFLPGDEYPEGEASGVLLADSIERDESGYASGGGTSQDDWQGVEIKTEEGVEEDGVEEEEDHQDLDDDDREGTSPPPPPHAVCPPICRFLGRCTRVHEWQKAQDRRRAAREKEEEGRR